VIALTTIVTTPSNLTNASICEAAEFIGHHYEVYDENGCANVRQLLDDLGGRIEAERNTESLHVRGRDRAETEADLFAAALLMPHDTFSEAFVAYDGDVWQLSARFGVSPAAARVRAQVLGLTPCFKQSRPNSSSWQNVFLEFYHTFPQSFAVAQALRGTSELQFDLWKPIGDELIYTCAVSEERHVHDAVRTWIDAMRNYASTPSLSGTGMGCKGGAFLATFPYPDAESSIPRRPNLQLSGRAPADLNREALQAERDHASTLYDFYGPSIDTGFRVVSKSTDRHFTLSLEVAYVLTSLSETPGKDKRDCKMVDLHLLTSESLKGVWGGKD
jgi:hypothetical protein